MKKIAFVFAFLLTFSFQVSAQIELQFSSSLNNVIESSILGGMWNDTLTWVGNQIPTSLDDVIINGPVKVGILGECLNLNISPTGILYDSTDASNISSIIVSGNLINNGIIKSINYGLQITLYGNLSNSGSWYSETMMKLYFTGMKNHFLSQSPNSFLNSNYIYLDQIGDSLTLLTDFYFEETDISLNTNNVICGSDVFSISNGIVHDGTILFDNGQLYKIGLKDVLVYGKVTLNQVRINGTIESFGEVINNDTLINIDGFTSRFISHSKFTNDGIITRNLSGKLYINILDDLHNNGFWFPNNTLFNPNGSAFISATEGNFIRGDRFDMTREMPGDTLKLLSDLTISVGYLDIGFSTIMISNKKLTLDNTLSNSNGYMISDSGTVKSINSNLGLFDIWGTLKIEGNLRCSYLTNFKDNLVIVDSFTNTFGGYIRCKNLYNYGTIYRTGNTYDVTILEGDLVNLGEFEIFTIYINGPTDQNIYLNHTINAQTWFVNDLPPWGEVLFYKNGIPYDTVGFFDSLTINDVGSYYYRSIYGTDTLFSRTINIEYLTSIENEENNFTMPKEFLLQQNYPNPFNPSTTIQYAISSTQFVTLKVYDLLGREVATLVNEEKPAGVYNAQFTMNNLPAGRQGVQLSSGIYFYKLQAGDFVETKKMLLLK